MPEPDFALVPKVGRPSPHPQKALLLIEVSSSSLRLDRKVKAPLYAEAEYWIVDVSSAQLEVFRAPKNGEWTEHFTLTAEGLKIDGSQAGTVEAAVRRALGRLDAEQVDAARVVLRVMADELARTDR